MDSKIDYLSWSVMVDCRGVGDADATWQAALRALWEAHPAFMGWCSKQRGWQPGGARGHYAMSQFNTKFYAAVRYGGSANHILVELPGTACQALKDDGLIDQVIAGAAGHMTRLDVAVDIPGGCSPEEFVAAGYNQRFKSHAEIISESGSTEYVGSMKSERYSRVYRYSAPHPRAGVLRIETVLRSVYAKAAAEEYAQVGLIDLAAECGNTFGWLHPTWQPGSLTAGKLKSTRADRHEPGRVRWLHKVVAPALVKASREGLIDLVEFWARIEALSAVT